VKFSPHPSCVVWLFVSLIGTIVSARASIPQWEMPPGWAETRGGEGGKVWRVNTLAPRGPGSLGEALAAEGPRVIEFAVGGVIDLGGRPLRIDQPGLTLAGETAPEPGITLTNGGIGIATHDVIVRHIRIRPGSGGRARGSGWEVDGLSTGRGAHDVIVDHCSITWSTDENLSASGPRFEGETPDDWRANTSHRITFSHCIIGEGLNRSTHSKGSHSKGSLLHDNTTDIAVVGNLYISNDDRNVLCKGGVRAAIVNNLIHNPGTRMLQYGYVPSQWKGRAPQRAAIVVAGNVARRGPSTAADAVFFEVWPAYGPCDLYLADNLLLDQAGRSQSPSLGYRERDQVGPFHPPREMRVVAAPPLWPPRLEAKPAAETAAWVLANVGARPWQRDAADRRLVEEARTGGGKIIDFESEVGGLPGPH